jgi:hypothetical protein
MLNSRNAIPLCAAAGLALGVLLALVLGSIFSVGGSSLMFEMFIYLFAGVVGGSALGAFIGFLLTGILPKASHEDSHEQMFSGVFNAVGGFILAAISLMFFWYCREVEAGGGEPEGRFPRIIVAVYLLLGKWGVLLVAGGAGLFMMVVGIRIMIPALAPAPKKKPKKKKQPNVFEEVPEDWEN